MRRDHIATELQLDPSLIAPKADARRSRLERRFGESEIVTVAARDARRIDANAEALSRGH
jgi:hypothetical protein